MLSWQPAFEQGLVYGLTAFGVYITFRILRTADLTVDGSFPLGAAVGATLIFHGYSPILALAVSLVAGCLAGCLTGILCTRFRITPLLSGILTMTALYSINLRIMGRPNMPLLGKPSVFRSLEVLGVSRSESSLLVFGAVAFAAGLFLYWFLTTEFGVALRATGSNPTMMRALGVNTANMQVLGLALSNGLVALSGSLAAQYQGFADVNLGIGMVISGLASVIIGEALLNGSLIKQLVGVLLGSLIYRSAIYLALRVGFAPTDLKLVTAVLVVLALVLPQWKGRFSGLGQLFKFIPREAGETEHA